MIELILAVIFLACIFWISKNTQNFEFFTYKRKAAMTQVERKLYYTICNALKNDKVIILAQVNMTGFLTWDGDNHRAFNHICRKSVDFLICDKEANPLVAIELQDKTHERIDRKLSDKTKAEALKIAKIPLVLFYTRTLPSVATVKKELEPFIAETKNYYSSPTNS